MKIPDHAAYKMLEKYKIKTPGWAFAKNLQEANIAAENLHFPVVVKIDSPDIIHKMKAGCVKTVFHRDHLRKMFETTVANAKKITKNINGVILQELVYSNTENVHELIVGAKHDEQFGLVIMFGAGGRLTEQHDVCFRLIPLTLKDAKEMVREPNISFLVNRHNKVADVLVNVSKMVEFEHITELDINPLTVSDKGVLAADVRIMIN